MSRFPEINLVADITGITATDLSMRHIRLLGLDVENVLTDYGDTAVRSEVRDHLADLFGAYPEVDFALITNKKDPGFVKEISAQLGDVAYYHPDEAKSLRGKTTADLFVAAATDFGLYYPPKPFERVPGFAAHVDDQFKTVKGLASTEWGWWKTFFWTEPYGTHEHFGVHAARPVERLVRNAIKRHRAAQPIRAPFES